MVASPRTRLLFFTILIEGYVVLAIELLTMRQLLPFIGSGIEDIAIIISSVLLPLAVGYYQGGKAHAGRHSLRVRLRRNLLLALALLVFGQSYVILEFFFHALQFVATYHLLRTSLYTLIFLVVPIYLLGQTIPLISNYFPRERLSQITGRMLCFSTLGSFLGSVFSTLVLMNTVGVHNTAIITLSLLFLLIVLLSRRLFSYDVLVAGTLMALLIFLNCPAVMRTAHVVSNGTYNMVQIFDSQEAPGTKEFMLNRSASSRWGGKPGTAHIYINQIQQEFLSHSFGPERNVLVVGAGGFTLGRGELRHHYTYVDIDPQLKHVAEKELLGGPLEPNKTFVPMSARAFVNQAASEHRHYDLILIDTYSNYFAIPAETLSRDFLLVVKSLLADNGTLIVNFFGHPTFSSRFDVRYDNTFSSVFPNHTRQLVFGIADPWLQRYEKANILYIYHNDPLMQDRTIYTDDKNSYSLDQLPNY